MPIELLWTDHLAAATDQRRAIHEASLAMIPALRERAVETERLRHMPAETVADLKASGLARILQPARFGGAEAPLAAMADVLIPMAAGCGSTAWAHAQYIMHNYMIARWPEAAQQAIWGAAPDALVSGILIPRLGKAERVAGGYSLTGRWPLVTGVTTSDWCILSAMVSEDGTLQEHYFLVPIDQVERLDTWHAVGLKGSASNDVTVAGLFVPEEMTVGIGPLKGGAVAGHNADHAPLFLAPVYMTFGLLLTSAVIGMAEAMRAEYLGQASVRIGLMSSRDDAGLVIQQHRIAEVSSLLSAAEGLLAIDAARMQVALNAGTIPDDRARTGFRANASYAGRLAWQAAQIMWDLSGSRGVYEPGPIGRAFRDIGVASRHITQNWDVNGTEHGRVLLGLPMSNPSL